jgi:hypothetical protein
VKNVRPTETPEARAFFEECQVHFLSIWRQSDCRNCGDGQWAATFAAFEKKTGFCEFLSANGAKFRVFFQADIAIFDILEN